MAVRLSEPGGDIRIKPRRARRVRQSKWPWEKIRKDYIEGIRLNGSEDPLDISWPTLVKVAEMYGVPAGTVQVRAGKEKWMHQRQSFQLRMDVVRKRERARLMAKEGRAFDVNVLNISKIGLNVILRRMAEISRSVQIREGAIEQLTAAMERGEVPDLSLLSNMPEFDAAEVERMANAATRFEELGRRVLGEPSEEAESIVSQEDEIITDVDDNADDDRLVAMLSVMQSTGLATQLLGQSTMKALGAGTDDDEDDTDDLDDEESEDVIDAEIVDEEAPNPVSINNVASGPVFSVA